MTIRPILIHPDPRLKKRCDPVTEITDELRAAAADMLETMYEAPGVGLAGPQVGLMKRILVMDCVKDPEAAPRPMVLVNPEVTWSSEELSTYEEGCLSIPEQYADVTRPAEVTVRWTGLDGAAQEEHFAGLWATCVQHEIDHLNGRVFVQYLSRLKQSRIKTRLLKAERAVA